MKLLLKRILSLSLCFVLVLILLPVSQADAAENAPLKYLSYTISNGEVTITDCDTSVTGYLIIPDTIDGFPVTVIGRMAFLNCKGLTKIKLGNYVTTIGEAAFYQSSLTEITIPASVTSIEQEGLDGMPTLKTVVFLGNPPQFDEYAFGTFEWEPDVNDPYIGMYGWSDFMATVYYPMHNRKWTANVMQRYGGWQFPWTGMHSRDEGTRTVVPTCTTDGSHSYTCTVCGENEIVTIPALGHSWDKGTPLTTATCTAEGITGYVCGICSEIKIETTPALGHTWNKGIITSQPTCAEAGVRLYSCQTCSETYEEAMKTIDHGWDKGTVTTQPTCTEAGVRLYSCGNCSATYEENIKATGHSWDKGTVTAQPTCTQDGVRLYTCQSCATTYEEATKATGHTWGDTVVVGTPNCLEAVTVDHICATCGTVGNRQTLTAPGHSYESAVQPATCTQPGQIVYTCKICGDTRSTETSPATGHQYESGTCTLCGTTLTGDINGDNTVDIADVARLYAHIRNTAPLEETHLQNADTTGDGAVDIADVARLYAHIKGTKPLT